MLSNGRKDKVRGRTFEFDAHLLNDEDLCVIPEGGTLAEDHLISLRVRVDPESRVVEGIDENGTNYFPKASFGWARIEQYEVDRITGPCTALSITIRECDQTSYRPSLNVSFSFVLIVDTKDSTNIITSFATTGAFRTDCDTRLRVENMFMETGSCELSVAHHLDSDGSVEAGPFVFKVYKNFDVQLLREKRALELLDHVSVIRAYEYFEVSNPPCRAFTMDYITGSDLHEHVVQEGRVGLDLARQLTLQIADAVNHIHSRGVIHRDLKPENIMVTPNLNGSGSYGVVIIDFGLSALLRNPQELTMRCGTAGYVAPEVLRGDKYGEKIDIFSLGCVLYFMVYGRGPFASSNANDILSKNKHCKPDFGALVQKTGAPAPLVNVITMCMAVEADTRITGDEVLQTDWLLGDDARNPTAPKESMRPNRDSVEVEERQVPLEFRQTSDGKQKYRLMTPMNAVKSVTSQMKSSRSSLRGMLEKKMSRGSSKYRSREKLAPTAEGEVSADDATTPTSTTAGSKDQADPRIPSDPIPTSPSGRRSRRSGSKRDASKFKSNDSAASAISERSTASEYSSTSVCTWHTIGSGSASSAGGSSGSDGQGNASESKPGGKDKSGSGVRAKSKSRASCQIQ